MRQLKMMSKVTFAFISVAILSVWVDASPSRSRTGGPGKATPPPPPQPPAPPVGGVCRVVNVTTGGDVSGRNCSVNSTCTGGPLRVTNQGDQVDVYFCHSDEQKGKPCRVQYSNGTEQRSEPCVFGSCSAGPTVVEAKCDNFSVTYCSDPQDLYVAGLLQDSCQISANGSLVASRGCSATTICPVATSQPVTVSTPSADTTVEIFYCHAFSGAGNHMERPDGPKNDGRDLCGRDKSNGSREGGRDKSDGSGENKGRKGGRDKSNGSGENKRKTQGPPQGGQQRPKGQGRPQGK